jgi:hypothetical protein
MTTTQQRENRHVKTLEGAARALNVSRKSVMRYATAIGLEKTRAGWALEPLRRERDRRMVELAATPDGARLLAARADERTAKARLAELELAIRRGDYVPRAEVRARNLEWIALVTRALEGWAVTLPPRLLSLDERAMRAILREEARAVRTRIARMCSLRGSVETPDEDRRVLEAEAALELAERFYAAAFGELPPRVACHGDPLTAGHEIITAALERIRDLRKGDRHGQQADSGSV